MQHHHSPMGYFVRATTLVATTLGLIILYACAAQDGHDLDSAYSAPQQEHVTDDPLGLLSAAYQEVFFVMAYPTADAREELGSEVTETLWNDGEISYAQTPNFYALLHSYLDLRAEGRVPTLVALEDRLAAVHGQVDLGAISADDLLRGVKAVAWHEMEDLLVQADSASFDVDIDDIEDVPGALTSAVARAPRGVGDLLCFGAAFDISPLSELGHIYDNANRIDIIGAIPDQNCAAAAEARGLLEDVMLVAREANGYEPTVARRSIELEPETLAVMRSVAGDREPIGEGPAPLAISGIDCAGILVTIVIIVIVAIILYLIVDYALKHFTGLGIGGHWQQQKGNFWNKCNGAMRDGEDLLDMSDLCDCIAYDVRCPTLDLEGIGAGLREVRERF